MTVDDLTNEIIKLLENNSDIKGLVVKLNESFFGEGNAILKLDFVTPNELEELKGRNVGVT